MERPIIFFDFFGTLFDGKRIVEGVRDLLASLQVTHRLIVVTSAPTGHVRDVLDQEGLTSLFTQVIGSDLGWSKAEAMERCGTQDAVIVTDTVNDIRSALSVGVKPVGVPWGVDSARELARGGALVVDSIESLQKVLAN